MVLWEIVTFSKVPYAPATNLKVYKLVTEEGYVMPEPKGCPPHFYDLMLDCWEEEPEDRPTFSDVLAKLANDVIPGLSSEPIQQPRAAAAAAEGSPTRPTTWHGSPVKQPAVGGHAVLHLVDAGGGGNPISSGPPPAQPGGYLTRADMEQGATAEEPSLLYAAVAPPRKESRIPPPLLLEPLPTVAAGGGATLADAAGATPDFSPGSPESADDAGEAGEAPLEFYSAVRTSNGGGCEQGCAPEPDSPGSPGTPAFYSAVRPSETSPSPRRHRVRAVPQRF